MASVSAPSVHYRGDAHLLSRRYIVITVSIGLLLCAISYYFVKQYTVAQVEKRVRDTMLECRAFHEYVQHNMHPEYYRLMQEGRLPQGFYAPEMLSSSYMARTFQHHYNTLRHEAGLPEIIYKMAATNPRNPVNRANRFEDSLIALFNSDRTRKFFDRVIDENGMKYLLSARPFLTVETRCLKCHGAPEDAPQELRKIYNWQGGFNLKVGDIVAIETVRSPLKGEFDGVMVVMMVIAAAIVVVVLLLLFNKRLRGIVSRTNVQLVESEQRYRAIAEDAPVQLCRFMPDGTITYVNSVCCYTFDSTLERMIGSSVKELLPVEDRDEIWLRITALTREEPIMTVEYQMERGLTRDVRWQRWTTRAVFDVKGSVMAYQANGEDITEMRVAQKTLAEERERLSVSLRSIGDGVITVDMAGRIELVNRVAENLTGWKQAEARGKPFGDVFRIINRNSRKSCPDPIAKIVSSGTAVELEDDTVLIARDGTERIIADSGAPIRDRASTVIGAVLVFRDITEKYQLQEVMNRTAKLDSLAVLAGGIAHDFNNLLGGIYGYTDLALELSQETFVRDNLEKSLSTIDRARGLTQQLLTFARGGQPVKKTASLFPFIEENARFAMCGSEVTLECSVQDGLWMCDYDRNQVGQVIDNLVINAVQAMHEGGTITVTARNVLLQKQSNGVLGPGKYVKISLRDTGDGIPQAALGKIFDPFFTTKDTGHGLGLATCNSIVERHGGCIEVESQEGVGTTFHLYFPAGGEDASPSVCNTAPHHEGHGIFYVLDDEAVMRTAMAEMLETLGYTVEVCETGDQVVASYFSRSDRNAVSGFLFDLTVRGGMGGEETLRRIREVDSDTPVFVTSGYSEDPIMADPRNFGFAASIRKPFRKSELVEMLSDHFGR